jgi:hypothetical protein
LVDETPLKLALLERGLVDEDLVDAALDRVNVYGGDLASQLLIMGAVEESDLIEVLAEVRDVEPANPEDYDRIDPDALMEIERPLMLEYSIIPFQKHRRNLGVFVVEPLSDTAVTELSETHGVRISQYIWPRLRYRQTLAALFDESLPEWAEDFDDGVELSFAEDLEIPPHDSENLSANSSPAIGRPVSEPHVEPDEIDFEDLGHAWSREQVLSFIEGCYNRDAVLYALLGYASWWLENRIIVVLGKDSIQPYLIDEWEELPDEFRNNERLRQLRVPVDPSAAIFDQDQSGHFLADKPEDVGLGDLFVELTLFPPDRLLNQSIKIGNRPYMLLVGEPKSRLSTVPPGIERLEEVAVKVGKQLESIIRAAKTDKLPPEGERIPSLPEPDGAFVDEVGNLESIEESFADDANGDDAGETEQQDIQVDGSATTGQTLEGTGSSFVELKDEADETEMSAPQLAGSSESESARQTQHLPDHDSEALESDDVSAPKLERDEDESRQTQSIPPGQAASSSADDSEPDDDEDEVSRTSFGIPFVDDSEDVAESDVSDAEPISEPSHASDISEESEPIDGAEYEVEESSSTLLGGFSVPDSQPIDEGTHPLEDVPDEPAESAEEISGIEVLEDEVDTGDSAPGCQIVRHISLAEGRKTLQESSAEQVSEDDEISEAVEQSEILDNGSVAFTDDDLEETADLLDSRNPANAFNAAEQIVEWGGRAVQELAKRFPGRLFVDRYEYTPASLPPAEEHGPVIAALANLGDRAVSVVDDHLEDSSVELRFYATLLFEELPVASVTEKLEERLFDRDMMIRDLAADILINRTDQEYKQEQLLPRLREEVEMAKDDLHVEVAARLLGRLRDRYAVPTLIEALEDTSGKVQQTIQGALANITYKKLSPSVSEWRNWWASAHEKSREEWIIEALNHDSEDVRRMVHHELGNWDDLELDYHPDQPKKLRARAQEQLREWFDARN